MLILRHTKGYPADIAGRSEVLGKDFACQVGDAAFIGERKLAGKLVDGNPGNINRFLVRIVFDGEFTAGGAQQVVVHCLVDAVPADGKPVIDAAQRGKDVTVDTGFLGNLTDRGFLVVLPAFRMTLRQAPLQPSAPVKAGNNRNPQFVVGRVHHDAAGRDLLNGGERGRGRVRCRRDVGTDCRWQRWVRPPAGSARYWMGHGVHSNDSCPAVMTGTWLAGGLHVTGFAGAVAQ